MIFNAEKDDALAAELRALRAAGGVPTLLLMRAGAPIHVGLSETDELAIIPSDRVTFDAAVGFRIEPALEGAP